MLLSASQRTLATRLAFLLAFPLLTSCLGNDAEELANLVTGDMPETTTTSTASDTITNIRVTNSPAALSVGQSVSLSIIGQDDSGRIIALTDPVLWHSLDSSIASIDISGVLTAVAAGTTTIEATSGVFTATVDIDVTTASAVALNLSPEALELHECQTDEITASMQMSDGSIRQLDADAGWNLIGLPNGILETLGNTALVTFSTHGTGSLSLTSGGVETEVAVTVLDSLVSLSLATEDGAVAPDTITIGEPQIFSVFGLFVDDSEQEISKASRVEIVDATPEAPPLTISQAGSGRFLLDALAPGSVTLEVRCGDLTSNRTISFIAPASIEALRIMEGEPVELSSDSSVELFAYAIYSDGTINTIDEGLTWSLLDNEDNNFVLEMSAELEPDTSGPVILSANTDQQFEKKAYLEVAYQNFTATTEVFLNRGVQDSLTGLVLILTDNLGNESILVEGSEYTVPSGTSIDLTASANYLSGTIRVSNEEVIWSNSNPSIATVDGDGRVNALSEGAAVISAHFGGLSASVPLLVTGPN